MAPHFVAFYACGIHVHAQCMCPGAEKYERVTDKRCPSRDCEDPSGEKREAKDKATT